MSEGRPEITLYQFAADTGVESASPFCAKVHRLLAFKRLAYELRDVGNPAVLKRLNPKARKVPVLEYDGEVVADSSRIFDFVDARHPTPPLWPEDRAQKARARLIEDWADESLYWFAVYQRWAVDLNFEPFRRRAFGAMPLPLRWFVPEVIRRQVRAQLHAQGLGRLGSEGVLAALEGHVGMIADHLAGAPFLFGSALTGADLAVFAPLRAMAIVEASPESAAVVRASRTVVAWLERVDAATTNEHTRTFG